MDLLVFTSPHIPLKYLFVLWTPFGKKISHQLYLASDIYLEYNLPDCINMYLPGTRNCSDCSSSNTISFHSFDALHLFRKSPEWLRFLKTLLFLFVDKYGAPHDVGSSRYSFPHTCSDGAPLNSISSSDHLHRDLHRFATAILNLHHLWHVGNSRRGKVWTGFRWLHSWRPLALHGKIIVRWNFTIYRTLSQCLFGYLWFLLQLSEAAVIES